MESIRSQSITVKIQYSEQSNILHIFRDLIVSWHDVGETFGKFQGCLNEKKKTELFIYPKCESNAGELWPLSRIIVIQIQPKKKI